MTLTYEPDELSPAGMLARQRRAVLLVNDGQGERGMETIWQAAAELAGGDFWQILDAKPMRQDYWLSAALKADCHEMVAEFFTPAQLAKAHKYGTPTSFSAKRPIMVHLDNLTHNSETHAWASFAPELRDASFVLALGHLYNLVKLRTLIELIHPLDHCVVLDSESMRLG